MICSVKKELGIVEPLRVIIEYANPVPDEESGGCLGCVVKIVLAVLGIWLLWQILKILGHIFITYILPFLVIVGILIGGIFLGKYLWNLYQNK